MIYSVLILAAASIAGMFTAAYFYDARNLAQNERDIAREESARFCLQIDAMENAAPDISSPAQDSFLELADLRRQLIDRDTHIDNLIKETYEMTARWNAALDERDVEHRRVAALRGQITKLTPKKPLSKH